MPEYAVGPDVVRVTLIVGVVFSMVVYERMQLTTGGAIVPAYLAMAVFRPVAVVATVLIGLATYAVVAKGIGRRWILYGRTKFEVEVLVGIAFILMSTVLAGLAGRADPALAGLAGIGFLVPGIIAHDMSRQRPGRTVAALLLTSAVLATFMWLYASILSLTPFGGPGAVEDLASVLGYPREFLLLAVATSVLVGMVVFAKLGIRSGGFITGAYVALVSPRWWDLAFSAIVAFIVWAIVVHVLMPRLLVFGRRKLSTMILVSGLVAWPVELLLRSVSHGDYVPWRGLTIATLMVPALIANDAQRQGWERTAFGVGLTCTGVLAVANLGGALTSWLGWSL